MIAAVALLALWARATRRRLRFPGGSGPWLVLGAIATAPARMPNLPAGLALAALTVLCSVRAFTLYFRLLARTTTVAASSTRAPTGRARGPIVRATASGPPGRHASS